MFIFLAVLVSSYHNDNPLRMWYDLPSSQLPLRDAPKKGKSGSRPPNYDNDQWQQNTLPIGNGLIGANIFGEIKNERLSFNEKTLWEGGPSPKRPNYNGGNNIEKGKHGETFRKIQQLFADGKSSEADWMCDELIGDVDGYGSYVEFGEIYLTFPNINEDKVKNFVRYLDLDTAISYVQYEYNNATITREYFVSYPDNVLVIHINTTNGVIPQMEAKFQTSFKSNKTVEWETITNRGILEDNEMKFVGKLLLKHDDGNLDEDQKNGKMVITDATNIVIYISAATNYKNEYPNYRTNETDADLNAKVDKWISEATWKSVDTVRDRHLKDYKEIFDRVKLNLTQAPSNLPTNEQLSNYRWDGGEFDQNRDLEVLLFQYGRYLTIGSSRVGSLPANLQGIWNDKISDVPWSSDYHININLQMNYFPTFVTNMAECALPLIDFIESYRIPGRVTAEIYTGIKSNKTHPENGFMAHTQTTPFGWTCPGWTFSWGWSPAAVPWMLQNVFDYYLYTKDEKILREKIYPMMKEEAIFFDQIMVVDSKTGRIISSPTYSPEHGPRTNGNVYEQELLWQHYYNTIKAAKILNLDGDLVAKWSEKLSKLNPIEIGDSGQIKEWYEETYLGSMGDRNHRHMSHLLGLYPGDLISVDTKEWLDAAIVSMNDRGDWSTGWAMGQRINAWARTGDGNRAHTLIRNLLKNGIYNNLWDFHPPFQIDGNFGATSGIAEMLLQSNLGYINILPSLPDVWANGEFDGFIARGNIEVGVAWKNNRATQIRLNPVFDGELTVQCKSISSAKIFDNDGKSIPFSTIQKDRIIFKGEAGKQYTISNIKKQEKSTTTGTAAGTTAGTTTFGSRPTVNHRYGGHGHIRV